MPDTAYLSCNMLMSILGPFFGNTQVGRLKKRNLLHSLGNTPLSRFTALKASTQRIRSTKSLCSFCTITKHIAQTPAPLTSNLYVNRILYTESPASPLRACRHLGHPSVKTRKLSFVENALVTSQEILSPTYVAGWLPKPVTTPFLIHSHRENKSKK